MQLERKYKTFGEYMTRIKNNPKILFPFFILFSFFFGLYNLCKFLLGVLLWLLRNIFCCCLFNKKEKNEVVLDNDKKDK